MAAQVALGSAKRGKRAERPERHSGDGATPRGGVEVAERARWAAPPTLTLTPPRSPTLTLTPPPSPSPLTLTLTFTLALTLAPQAPSPSLRAPL